MAWCLYEEITVCLNVSVPKTSTQTLMKDNGPLQGWPNYQSLCNTGGKIYRLRKNKIYGVNVVLLKTAMHFILVQAKSFVIAYNLFRMLQLVL